MMTRKQAQAQGLARYLGLPCKHGHEGWRFKTGHCVACVESARAAPQKREEARQRARSWYAQNQERAAITQRSYREQRPGYDKASKRAWKKRNPGKVNADTAARRAARLQATVPGFEKELEQIYSDCPTGLEVDHIYPLRHKLCCGLHVPWNLQYLTPKANKKKSNKLPSLAPTEVCEGAGRPNQA